MSFYNRAILDAHGKGVPKEVVDEMRKLWRDRDLGNDYCYYPWFPEDDDEKYPLIAKYIRDNQEDEENILIHFWW